MDQLQQKLNKAKAFDELKDFVKEQKEKAIKCLNEGYYLTQQGRDNLVGEIDVYNKILKKAGTEDDR